MSLTQSELARLFHKLNNQLGIILANAELLETRVTDQTQKARAGQVVKSVLEAIDTVQQLRRELPDGAEPAITSPGEPSGH